MAKVEIETTQNVLLDFELGELGDRIGAALIDEVIKGLYLFLVYYFAAQLVSGFDGGEIKSFLFLKFFLGLPVLFYYPVLEYFWNGQTVGKNLLKLKVIRLDGAKPSMGDFLIRYLFRTIDTQGGFLIAVMTLSTFDMDYMYMILIFLFLAPFPVIGILSVAFTKKNQRIGDLVSGTLVVKMKQRASLEDTLLLSVKRDYKPRFQNVLRLSDKDIRIIKEALEVYSKNQDPKHVIALAKKTKEILEIEGKFKPVPLLKTILKDYNILALEKA